MKLINYREGFATNSSSSHSIVLNTKHYPEDDNCMGEYGWEDFLLTETKTKQHYIDLVKGTATEGYVDHNSCDIVPESSLLQDLIINHPSIAIRGGNDNDGDSQYKLKEINLEQFDLHREDGRVTVLFNSKDGTKLRYSMDPTVTYPRASWPELVDIKITDYCAEGCNYCYQGSTKKGKHADLDSIKKAIDRFSEVGVFEIAIGGGEPTTHPNFKEILEYAISKKVIPNFTTRKIDWLCEEIIELIGAMAFSVDSVEDMRKYDAVLKDRFATKKSYQQSNGGLGYYHVWRIAKSKIHFQHVLGTTSDYEYERMLDFCQENDYTFTLLGYKTTGRGSKVQPVEIPNWLQLAKSKTKWNFRIGIDTELVRTNQKALEECKISEDLYTKDEGTHSCYVDAVKGTLHPSSYDGSKGVPFEDDWIEQFQSFEISGVDTLTI